MIGKSLKWLIAVLLGTLIVMIAVANRQPVTFTLDPLDLAGSSLTFVLPLFVLILVVAIAGIVVGGVAVWFRQRKWRRASRRSEGEVRALQADNVELRRRIDTAGAAAMHDTARLPLRPPAA